MATPPTSFSVLPIKDGKVPSAVNSGTFELVAPTPNTPVQGPNYPVGHAGVVRVRATVNRNGLGQVGIGNQGNVWVGLNRDEVMQNGIAGGAYMLTPNTEVVFPVDTLAQIWLCTANAGDGIQLSVKGTI